MFCSLNARIVVSYTFDSGGELIPIKGRILRGCFVGIETALMGQTKPAEPIVLIEWKCKGRSANIELFVTLYCLVIAFTSMGLSISLMIIFLVRSLLNFN